MKQALGYIRVSTNGQAEDGYGADAQREIIETFAKERGYEIIGWRSDLGVSGADDITERPELSEIVYGDVFNPPIEAVLVADSKRVARDISIYFGIRYLLGKKGVELVSCEYDFGQFGVFRDVIEATFAALAQLERDSITQRTSAGRRQKARQGRYAGGNTPTGYKVENGELVIDEEEAKAVRTLFRWHDLGMSFRQMAEMCKEHNVLNRGGKPFSKSSIHSIIQNRPTYEGMYRYGDMEDWVEGEHEAII